MSDSINISKLTIDGTQYTFKDTGARSLLGNKADVASPAFSGTPTAPTAEANTNTDQIATTAFVMNAFAANDAMLFKGTIGSNGATVTELPANHKKGWTYKVATAGTYAGIVCEVGDMIICVTNGTSANNAHWTVVQANIDGAVIGPASSTEQHVAIFSGTTGKVVADSGYTIAKSVPSDAKFTDTTYTSKSASAGGTDVSLVTTGEKATWNGKLNSNQGSGNAGKFLMVDNTGAVVPTQITNANGVSF